MLNRRPRRTDRGEVPERPPPRDVRVLRAAVVALVLGFAGWTVLTGTGPPVPLRDDVLGPAAAAAPGLLWLRRAAAERTERTAGLLLGVGILCYGLGDGVYSLLDRGGEIPFPSAADAAYLATYPLLGAGLLLVARRRMGRLPWVLWLDTLLCALATAAVVGLVAVPLLTSDGTATEVLVTSAYPAGGLLLLVLLAGTATTVQGGRVGRQDGVVLAGLLLYAVADVVHLMQVAEDSYVVGAPLDALWPAGLCLIGLAAWTSPGRDGAHDGSSARALLLPGAAVLLAVVLLAVPAPSVPTPSVVLAVLTLLVALARWAVAFAAVRTLAASRLEACTDDLTGLANRRAFTEGLAARLAGEQPPPLAVLLVDLDRFKEVNDTLGHHVGDELLRLVAPRLLQRAGPGGLVARLGGDEFGLVLPAADAATARAAADGLVEALAAPLRLDGVLLRVSGSVGVAVSPQDGTTPDLLLRHADVAMYAAKARGGGIAAYDPAVDRHTREALVLAGDLRSALEDDELVVHYQPVCDVATGRATGVEALVRWQHPVRGLLYPDAFLPQVRLAGLMPALTAVVLRAALAQCRTWRAQGLDLGVGVNLSASLCDEGLVDQVQEALARAGVPPGSLVLEITEELLVEDPVRASTTLSALRHLGVRVAVDDYGTGFSSLAYLRDLPVDHLKLDRSFLRDVGPGSRGAAVVASTVDLAHALGMRMIAEGVEDEESLALLRRVGCDLAQGYHLSRPQPAEALTAWLTAHVGWTAPARVAPRRPAKAGSVVHS